MSIPTPKQVDDMMEGRSTFDDMATKAVAALAANMLDPAVWRWIDGAWRSRISYRMDERVWETYWPRIERALHEAGWGVMVFDGSTGTKNIVLYARPAPTPA